jgi:predicted phosphodiesterase
MNLICREFPADWQSLELYPLSDLHVGDPRCDVKMFERFIEHILAAKNRYLIYNGDNLNNATKSSVSNVYNDTMSPNEQRKWLTAKLEPVADRFLVFVSGNHEYRSKKDVDFNAVETMAEKLGVPFVEDEAALKISVGRDAKYNRCTYGIMVTHGAGGGKYVGSSMNNAENYALTVEGADLVVLGHCHKKAASIPAVRKFDFQNNILRSIEKVCVISSHWADFGGYAARKMLRPSSKGSVPVFLNGRQKQIEVRLATN